MSQNRPDETLAPLITMTEVDRLSCISAIDVAQGLRNVAELHTLRLLFGEMEAQRGALARMKAANDAHEEYRQDIQERLAEQSSTIMRLEKEISELKK